MTSHLVQQGCHRRLGERRGQHERVDRKHLCLGPGEGKRHPFLDKRILDPLRLRAIQPAVQKDGHWFRLRKCCERVAYLAENVDLRRGITSTDCMSQILRHDKHWLDDEILILQGNPFGALTCRTTTMMLPGLSRINLR